jgi:hypothetical protein
VYVYRSSPQPSGNIDHTDFEHDSRLRIAENQAGRNIIRSYVTRLGFGDGAPRRALDGQRGRSRMRRREFIPGPGSAAAWPVVARAQQGDRVRRIGVLMSLDEADPEGEGWLSSFACGHAELGWIDGRTVRPPSAPDRPVAAASIFAFQQSHRGR